MGFLKLGPDIWPPQVNQQSPRNRDAHSAAQEIPSDAIDQVSQNLSGDDGNGDSPSPRPTAKPSHSGKRQDRAEHQEGDTRRSTERDELIVGDGIEFPHLVENRARPGQRCSRERSHRHAKKKKGPKGDEPIARSSKWVLLHTILHSPTID